MTERRVDGFFYGLFMDPDVLAANDVAATAPRMAYVDDFALRIGKRATLMAQDGVRAYGMVYALTHEELGRLYGAPGLESYRPEAMIVSLVGGGDIPALCYNLIEPPAADERNPDYAAKLRAALRSLGFPDEYVSTVA